LQPFERITNAALPLKAPKRTSLIFGDRAGECRLASAGVAEKAKDLRRAAPQPEADCFERRILLR
jgi:hypothetical protein